MIREQPDVSNYKMEFPLDEMPINPDLATNGKRIIYGWLNVYGKCVLDAYQDYHNPLQRILKEMKINFNSGGFFTIKRVKWD